jgi:hypothetical protein
MIVAAKCPIVAISNGGSENSRVDHFIFSISLSYTYLIAMQHAKHFSEFLSIQERTVLNQLPLLEYFPHLSSMALVLPPLLFSLLLGRLENRLPLTGELSTQ